MENLIEHFPNIANSVNDNPYGLLALAVLVLACVAIGLMKNAPASLRAACVFLVFLSTAALIFIVYDEGQGLPAGSNGALCSGNSDCNSGSCRPGPHPNVDGSGLNYCLAGDRQCAVPGFDGAMHNSQLGVDGTLLTCRNPGNGAYGQFVR